jgi:hypothetical protein
MREFPDIVVADPNYWLWLWLIIPAALAVGFLLAEFIIERWTEKKWGKAVVGVGYIAMGVMLFISAMAITLVPDAIYAQHNDSAVSALEDIGFTEVRLNIDTGTYGAYYDGELMRGVLVEIQAHPGNYQVVEVPDPVDR